MDPRRQRGVQIFPEMISAVTLSTHSLHKQMGHFQSPHPSTQQHPQGLREHKWS